jgi:hypothetical protein
MFFAFHAFISQVNTQTMHIKSITLNTIAHNSIAMFFPLKTLYRCWIRTRGPSVPESDAMSTALRRHRALSVFFKQCSAKYFIKLEQSSSKQSNQRDQMSL